MRIGNSKIRSLRLEFDWKNDKFGTVVDIMRVMFVIMIIILFMLSTLARSEEIPKAPKVTQSQTSILSLYEHLIELPPKWKEAYGDTLETRFIYNLAVLRSNQMEIAKMISMLHPPVEPNDPIDPNE